MILWYSSLDVNPTSTSTSTSTTVTNPPHQQNQTTTTSKMPPTTDPSPGLTAATTAWRSRRLLYRAIEDTPADRQTLHLFADADPFAISMSSLRPVAPLPLTSIRRLYENVESIHLRAFICLPPSDAEVEEWEALVAEKCEVAGVKARLDVEKLRLEYPRPGPTPIGVVTLRPNGGPETMHHRNAQIGVGLGEQWRGKGYGGEAVNWVLDWGFGRLGLHRIWLDAFEYNERACGLYKKLGFVEEGREREAVLWERGWWDLVRFGMLEGEGEVLRGKGKSEVKGKMEEEKKKEE